MRVVAEIPHNRFKIQIHAYNGKYIVKIELGQFEQVFKIGETDVMGIDEVKAMISPDLLQKCLNRFVQMREDWETSFQLKNSNHEN